MIGWSVGLGVAVLAVVIYRRYRRVCDVYGCSRTGRYDAAGGRYRVCALHEPGKKASAREIRIAHRKHLRAARLRETRMRVMMPLIVVDEEAS